LFLGKVIGNVWATKKYPTLTNMKLMFVQPMNAQFEKTDEPIIAVSEAVIPLPVEMAPVDASIVGIVDTINSVY